MLSAASYLFVWTLGAHQDPIFGAVVLTLLYWSWNRQCVSDESCCNLWLVLVPMEAEVL